MDKVCHKSTEMKKFAKWLAGSAKENGICQEWGDRLAGCNDDQIDKMMIMYVKGIDFCMENNWPDLDTVRNHFKGRMEHHGVHCDEECQIKNVQFTVLLGRCRAAISFDQYSVGEIYVRHETKAEIAISDHSFVRLDVYDKSEVKIIATGNAKISIKNHGDAKIEIERSDDAIVKLNNKIF